jgi:hypothetical protein
MANRRSVKRDVVSGTSETPDNYFFEIQTTTDNFSNITSLQ